jgi:tetratricopeptide (TPR) repeat protein
MDDWGSNESGENQQRLLELTAQVDPASSWRKQLLRPGVLGDRGRLLALLKEVKQESLAPASAVLLAALLGQQSAEAVELLARVRERKPDDFWLNFSLAQRLEVPKDLYVEERDRGRQEEAIGYYRAALAVKPDSSPTWNNLGNALRARGDVAGAIRSYREAIRLGPKDGTSHAGLGLALKGSGDFPSAADAFRKAVELFPPAHPLSQVSSDQLAQCKRLMRLEPILDAVLAGNRASKDAAERIDLA